MLLYKLLVASVILDVAKPLSTGEDFFNPIDISDPIDLDPLRTSESLFLAGIDDSAADGLASYYSPVEGLNVDETSVNFHLAEDQSSISDALPLSSEENMFASNLIDLFDEGDVRTTKTFRPPCEANLITPRNLIERSLSLDEPTEDQADSSRDDYCVPSKSKNPPPQLDLPENFNDLYNLLKPKPPPAPLLDDPFLRFTPYRVICPLDGDYSLLCCAEGSGMKKIRCSKCRFLHITIKTLIYVTFAPPRGYLTNKKPYRWFEWSRLRETGQCFLLFSVLCKFRSFSGIEEGRRGEKNPNFRVMSCLLPISRVCECDIFNCFAAHRSPIELRTQSKKEKHQAAFRRFFIGDHIK